MADDKKPWELPIQSGCGNCASDSHTIDECPFKKTYVYNDTEVKLTGRTADKQLKAMRKNSAPGVATLHEITPNDSLNGSWKKWVRMTELFEIK